VGIGLTTTTTTLPTLFPELIVAHINPAFTGVQQALEHIIVIRTQALEGKKFQTDKPHQTRSVIVSNLFKTKGDRTHNLSPYKPHTTIYEKKKIKKIFHYNFFFSHQKIQTNDEQDDNNNLQKQDAQQQQQQKEAS
jgi:hypothetical protein